MAYWLHDKEQRQKQKIAKGIILDKIFATFCCSSCEVAADTRHVFFVLLLYDFHLYYFFILIDKVWPKP